MSINTHVKMLDELLENITTATELKELCASSAYIKFYMEAATNDVWTLVKIENLKITRNDYHRSMAGVFLINRHTVQLVRDVIMAQTGSVLSKEKQFLSMSSMLFEAESKILEAILKKDLTSLYPALTHELICEALA